MSHHTHIHTHATTYVMDDLCYEQCEDFLAATAQDTDDDTDDDIGATGTCEVPTLDTDTYDPFDGLYSTAEIDVRNRYRRVFEREQ